MNEIVKIYNDHQVRIIQKDGDPWFVAKDVAEILDYRDTEHMTRRLDDDELGKIKSPVLGDLKNRFGNNDITIISEAGLYTAIIGSKKKEARDFKRWVTHEVLPSIRKTGAYVSPNMKLEQIAAVAKQIGEMAKRLIAENAVLHEKIAYLEQFIPKGNLGDPSDINGKPKWQQRRGCYVSGKGSRPKRLNPETCGYLQPDLFRDFLPAVIIADAINIININSPKLLESANV